MGNATWLVSACGITLVMLLSLGWHLVITHDKFQNLVSEAIELEHRRTKLLNTHQRLDFFLRLSVIGDWHWPLREYGNHLRVLSEQLGELSSVTGRVDINELEAFIELRSIEKRVIEFIDKGDRKAAGQLLYGVHYATQFDQLSKMINQAFNRKQQHLKEKFSLLERQDMISFITAFIIFSLSIITKVWSEPAPSTAFSSC